MMSGSHSGTSSKAPEDEPVLRRCALVLGGTGFIGASIVGQLRRRGWRVLSAVRPGAALMSDERPCDLAKMVDADSWNSVLDGVDAVVNAAGILRETPEDTFEAVHCDAPLALARACVQRGVTQFVQISAMGLPADGEFIASKHRFDDALRALLPTALILRPSVIFATSGSHGGTSLLRALAAVPIVLPLPGRGQWMIQPSAADDLAALVAIGLDHLVEAVYEVGGPRALTLRDYQLSWRRWLRVPGKACWCLPESWIDVAMRLGDVFGRGPMTAVVWRMLRRGNVAQPGAHATLRDKFGFAPRDVETVLAEQPSSVQDRWHARLHLLVAPLRLSAVALWLLSAVAGWMTPAHDIERMAAGSWLAASEPVALARLTAGLDLVLACWLAVAARPRPAILLMMLSVLAYTFALGVAVPWLWLDALGGLAKNLVILPALAVLWVLVERR